MKRLILKKHIILPVLAAASFGLSSLALADNVNNTNPSYTGSNIVIPSNNNNSVNSSGIINAIEDVGNKMVALGFAGMTAFDQAMYQFDQNLVNIVNANTAASTVEQDTSSTSVTNTNNYIQSSLQDIPNSFLSTAEGAINADTITDQIKNQNVLVNNLTLGVPGSDTLYINDPTALSSGYGSLSPAISNYYNTNIAYKIGPPPINDDNYFSISSLLGPSVYTSSDLNAANAYMAYLTQSYNNPASMLNLSDLKSYVNGLKPRRQPAALYKFLSSSQYQDYQLALRSYTANKSVAINNFEHLIAERTPSKTAVSGIYDNQGNEISKPSPLQVEQYQANNRIDNPTWLQSLQSMSSTSLQREIAVELAQVIKQNQQAHMDRERILTTLSAMQLQGSQASAMTLNTLAQQVNQQISSLTGKHNNNRNNTAQETQKAKEASQKNNSSGN